MLKVKCQAHVRTEKSMHMSFHEMEASASFVFAGLGIVEAGPPEVFSVAEVLGNKNLQCVINEHSDLGPNQRNPKKYQSTGSYVPRQLTLHLYIQSSGMEPKLCLRVGILPYISAPKGRKQGSQCKVQQIARLSNSFPQNQLLSASFACTDQW